MGQVQVEISYRKEGQSYTRSEQSRSGRGTLGDNGQCQNKGDQKGEGQSRHPGPKQQHTGN